MDSTTLLYYLVSKGDKVLAISFDYGQRHRKELEYAAKTCKKLKVNWRVCNISSVGAFLQGNALTSMDIEVPEGHYEDESMRLTVVPNRNMIMMSIAGGYAISQACDRLAIAVHGGDHAIYPDCRPIFVKCFEKTLQVGNYEPVSVYAPFLNWSKAQIAELGRRLGINYEEETWSCYRGEVEPCGKCGTCIERREALKHIGQK
jgi:7-cyano-7-deazaguanine synthase